MGFFAMLRMTRLCEGAVATAAIVWEKELWEIATPLACGSRFAMTRERVVEKASVDGRGTPPVIPGERSETRDP